MAGLPNSAYKRKPDRRTSKNLAKKPNIPLVGIRLQLHASAANGKCNVSKAINVAKSKNDKHLELRNSIAHKKLGARLHILQTELYNILVMMRLASTGDCHGMPTELCLQKETRQKDQQKSGKKPNVPLVGIRLQLHARAAICKRNVSKAINFAKSKNFKHFATNVTSKHCLAQLIAKI